MRGEERREEREKAKRTDEFKIRRKGEGKGKKVERT